MEFKNFDHWKTIMKNKVTFNSRVNSMDLATLPKSVNADLMTDAELRARIEAGFKDLEEGRTMDASETFQLLREKHNL